VKSSFIGIKYNNSRKVVLHNKPALEKNSQKSREIVSKQKLVADSRLLVPFGV
jgi:hypothetical protein